MDPDRIAVLLAQRAHWLAAREQLAASHRLLRHAPPGLADVRLACVQDAFDREYELRGPALAAALELSAAGRSILAAVGRAQAGATSTITWTEANMSHLAADVLDAADLAPGGRIHAGGQDLAVRRRRTDLTWWDPQGRNGAWPLDAVAVGSAHAWVTPPTITPGTGAHAVYEHLRDRGIDPRHAADAALDSTTHR